MVRRGKSLWRVPAAAFIILALLGGQAYAQTSEEVTDPTSEEVSSRPPRPGTEVAVKLIIEEVLDIDERESLVEVDATLTAEWFDKRQSFDCGSEGGASRVFSDESASEALKTNVWSPGFNLREGRGPRDVTSIAVTVFCEGNVRYRERFLSTIQERFGALNDFPFDSHTIQLTIEPFALAERESVVFREFDKVAGLDDEFDLFSSDDWESEEWVFSAVKAEQVVDPIVPVLTTQIHIDRKSTFYVMNIVTPLIVIVALSWAVFWMDEKALAERMGVSTTSLLTVVAFDFLTSDNLPKLEFTTRLDAFYNVSYLFVALTVAVSLIVLSCAKNALPKWLAGVDNTRFKNLDHISQRVFPVAYLGMVALTMVGVFSPGAGGYGSWLFGDGPADGFFDADTEDFEDFDGAFGMSFDELALADVELGSAFDLLASIDAPGEVDGYRVCLAEGESISVWMTRQNPDTDSLDPLLVLYADDGSLVAFDDDGGRGIDSLLDIPRPEAGCYQLIASDLSGQGTGEYWLSESGEATEMEVDLGYEEEFSLEDLYADFSLAFGTSLAEAGFDEVDSVTGATRSGTLEDSGDFDAYEFCVGAGAVIEAQMESRPGLDSELFDPLLLLYDEAETFMALDDDGAGDFNSRLVYESPSGGCYLLVATELSGLTAGTYDLTVLPSG